MKQLSLILSDAVKDNNPIIIRATAIAASTFTPEDKVDLELIKVLHEAFKTEDAVTKSDVTHAIEANTGESLEF